MHGKPFGLFQVELKNDKIPICAFLLISNKLPKLRTWPKLLLM